MVKPNTTIAIHLLLMGTSACGLILSVYLSGLHKFHLSAICGPRFQCDKVLDSKWSMFFGVPVSTAGVLGFAAILLVGLISVLPEMDVAPAGQKIVRYLTTIGLVISLVLTGISLIVLHAICIWCLASLSCMAACWASGWALRKRSAPGGHALALGSALMLSASGIASLRLWDLLEATSERMPVSMGNIAKVPINELLAVDTNLVSSKRDRQFSFVGFFLPECGGCQKSIENTSKAIQSRDDARFIIRFVQKPNSSADSTAEALEALAKRENGYSIVVDFISTLEDDPSVENLQDFLQKRNIPAPNAVELLYGKHVVEENVRLSERLGAIGFPVLLRAEKGGVTRAVEPITLEDYNGTD